MKIKLFLKNLIYRMRGTYTVEQLVKMGLTVGENFNPQLGTTLDPSGDFKTGYGCHCEYDYERTLSC